jgi:predicted HD superfamily hydrolase involved in NAD metabolism
MMHDIARMWKPAELLEYARLHGMAISTAEQQAPVLLHSRIGAHIARERFGVDDADMLHAIEHHTVAVPGMTVLEKILYTADRIEPSRSLAQRAALAELADRSLDQGFLACVKSSMEYLARVGIPIAPQTLTFYNQSVRSET